MRNLKTAEIIFEGKSFLILNKKAGVVVNRSKTTGEFTLQDDLALYFGLGGDLGIGNRAGIVHRLDRETSGLMLIAKTQRAFEYLQRQFKERKVKKEYMALVHGRICEEEGIVEKNIGRIGKFGKFGVVREGKESATAFRVRVRYHFKCDKFESFVKNLKLLTKSRINYLKKNAKDYTLLSLFPKTGRTHQLRVHIKSMGYFPVSDLIYTPRKLLKFDVLWCPRLFLHASHLEFEDLDSKRIVKFSIDLPKDLKSVLSNLTIGS